MSYRRKNSNYLLEKPDTMETQDRSRSRPQPTGRLPSCSPGLGLTRSPCSERIRGHRWARDGGGGAQQATCVPRLALLHQLLQPLAGCARVVQCAEAVPTLLQAFFSAVTQVSPP